MLNRSKVVVAESNRAILSRSRARVAGLTKVVGLVCAAGLCILAASSIYAQSQSVRSAAPGTVTGSVPADAAPVTTAPASTAPANSAATNNTPSMISPAQTRETVITPLIDGPVVQIAILLDTSGSMDGLIEQAKTQLWAIVNQFATSKQNGLKPRLQVAVYQYGNDSLEEQGGYVQQILTLTNDLDAVSSKLFALSTNGGSEYCGTVIKHATTQLNWSTNSRDLRMIVIAGNEPFTQGGTNYQETVPLAAKKGIVVNTIFCGNRSEGSNTNWEDGAKLGEGVYFNIDQSVVVPQIDAPQDQDLIRLSSSINETYIAYGAQGQAHAELQSANDAKVKLVAPAAAAERATSKATSLYSNTHWDVCDAVREGTVKLEEIKVEDLPENMKKMTNEQRVAFVNAKQAQRTMIQEEIAKLTKERDEFIAQKRKEMSTQAAPTFGEALLAAIRTQGAQKGYEFAK